MHPSQDEALFMLAVLTSSADGVPHDDEIEAVQWSLAPQLVRMGPAGRRRALEILTDALDREGLAATLQILGNAIAPSRHDEAFRLVLDIAWADRRMTRQEEKHVEQIAALLGIPAERRQHLVRTRKP